jgi:microcystin-dependent protein
MFAASIPPDGWLLCNGGAYDRTEYAALFAVIGTTYGTSTATNFFVPNFASRFPVGASPLYPLATSGGSKDHEHSNGTVSHSHTGSGSDAGHSHGIGSHSHSGDSHTHTFTSSTHTHGLGSHSHQVVSGNHSHGGITRGTGVADSTQAPTVNTSGVAFTSDGNVASGTTGSGGTGATGSTSLSTGSASASVSVGVGNGSTTAHTASIDKSLPPYLSIAFIIKA